MGDIAGEGHFTRAFLADDLLTSSRVCVKRHRGLTIEALSDLLNLGQRLEEADKAGEFFPRILDAFYDQLGYTVESLVEGQNCLSVARCNPSFFTRLDNLRVVARGGLSGLTLLERVGVVHNDVKPDNLIWCDTAEDQDMHPRVKIVDFGCARLDQREEPGRNWSLAEGGAGHLGKWSPEMALRIPITHMNDVWGMAISICELYCGRSMWRNEADTVEVVVAQIIGLCNLRDGLPRSLLRRSPLDVRLLYTPAPAHFPLRRNTLGQLEVLRPSRWGLEQVLGERWREHEHRECGEFLEAALCVDAIARPSAAELLEACTFVSEHTGVGEAEVQEISAMQNDTTVDQEEHHEENTCQLGENEVGENAPDNPLE